MTTKLLLADDSVTIHQVVRLTLAAEKIRIEAVADGDQALVRARADRPDIVLADVSMPGRNGFELCAAIKADPQLALTPVVLLVGAFEPFDEREATRVHCDAFLTKPFDTDELIQVVRRLVNEHKAAQAAADAEGAKMDTEPPVAVAACGEEDIPSMDLVTERTRSSFLGANRILDLFDPPEANPAPSPGTAGFAPATGPNAAPAACTTPSQIIPFPSDKAAADDSIQEILLSEETIDRIVSQVMERMSEKVVREIAWEVVPEISGTMIRQYIDELRTKTK